MHVALGTSRSWLLGEEAALSVGCTAADALERCLLVCILQGTAMLGKGLMSRNYQFTKLMGDVNKDQRLL